MVLSVNTNTGSLSTVRNLSVMQRSARKTSARLSSRLEVSRTADDPAGLTVSERMRAQIGSIAQKITSLDNAINRNNTANSCLEQMESRLLEMREIAVAVTSTGYVDEGMTDVYENELNALASSFNDIIDGAAFGKKKLLDGSDGSLADIGSMEMLDLSTSPSAEQAIVVIDEKLAQVYRVHGELVANTAHELASLRTSLEVSHDRLVGAESAIPDADMAKEQTTLTAELLSICAGTAMLAQGNLMAQNVLGLISAS